MLCYVSHFPDLKLVNPAMFVSVYIIVDVISKIKYTKLLRREKFLSFIMISLF